MHIKKEIENMGYKLSQKVDNKVFEKCVLVGDMLYVSGHAAKINGSLYSKGRIGGSISIKEAKEAAKVSFVNCLSSIEKFIGDLNNIKRIINVKGYMSTTADFYEHALIMDEVSMLINKVFKERGEHTRTTVGLSSLPGGTPVEIEMIVQVYK